MSYFFTHRIRQIRVIVFAMLVAASSSLSADIIDNIAEAHNAAYITLPGIFALVGCLVKRRNRRTSTTRN